MESITVTAAAKLLLSGEHAVLAGAPAAGMPLPLRLRLTLTPTANSATGDGVRFAPRYAEPLERYRPFIFELERELRACGVGDARIDIDSDIPVAPDWEARRRCALPAPRRCARYIAPTKDHPKDRTEYIWNTAHRLERHFHGRSSGIDTGIIAAAAPTLFFHRRRPLAGTQITTPYSHYRRQPIANLRIAMAIIVLPRHRTTKQMVATIAPHGAIEQNGAIEQSAASPPANDDPQIEEHATMDAFCAQSERFAEWLADDDETAATGYQCVRLLYRLQQQMGISTAEIDAFIERAIDCGAAAGKVSGAGGGGSAFALFDDRAALSAALPDLRRFCADRYPHYRLYWGEYTADRGWRGFSATMSKAATGL